MSKLPHCDSLATLEGKCIVANPELVSNGDQVTVTVDHELCIRGLQDVGVLVVLLDPFHPVLVVCHAQTISVLKDMLAHLFVG